MTDRSDCIYLKKQPGDNPRWCQSICLLKPPSVLHGLRYIDTFKHCPDCLNYANQGTLTLCKQCKFNLMDHGKTEAGKPVKMFCNKTTEINHTWFEIVPEVDPDWGCSEAIFLDKF